MKSKWAAGIAPRNFAWIIKDKLAISERPGGYARTHRRVRRAEEIIWLRHQGFVRVVSMLASPHNLHAYAEEGIAGEHRPLATNPDARAFLAEFYPELAAWASEGPVLLHQEELSDQLLGIAAGYLVWAGLVPTPEQAISIVEQINHRQVGPPGRSLVAAARDLAAGSSPAG